MSFTVILFRQNLGYLINHNCELEDSTNTIQKYDSKSDFPCKFFCFAKIPKYFKTFCFREDRGGVVKSRADNDITFLVSQYFLILKFAILYVETWSKKLTRNSCATEKHIPNF